MISDKNIDVFNFQKKIYGFYSAHKRDFAWRNNIDPYRVFVSEVMLQQTQTSRVAIKFEQWVVRFPDFENIATASTQEVLSAWQGLGYNRRGLNLQKAARKVIDDFGGILPQTVAELESLPGIGINTAGSIMAFAFNMPVVFIETNIRTVFLHEFFNGVVGVDDKDILALVALTLDQANPREWYYALMDYGVHLKKALKVSNKASKHYKVQSKFVGSRREMRGAIVRALTKMKELSADDLVRLLKCEIPYSQHDIDLVLRQLVREGLVRDDGKNYSL